MIKDAKSSGYMIFRKTSCIRILVLGILFLISLQASGGEDPARLSRKVRIMVPMIPWLGINIYYAYRGKKKHGYNLEL